MNAPSIGDVPFGALAIKPAVAGASLRRGGLPLAPLMDGHDAHAPTPFKSEELDRSLISLWCACLCNGEIFFVNGRKEAHVTRSSFFREYIKLTLTFCSL